MLKYKSPALRASPSLSVAGSDDLAPKYVSSKLSAAAAAAVAELAAAVAELAASLAFVVAVSLCPDAVDAELAAAVAELAAAVALVAAAVALVAAVAASTNNDHFALSVFEVSGWEPLDVCAVIQKKILFVEVSLTMSRKA